MSGLNQDFPDYDENEINRRLNPLSPDNEEYNYEEYYPPQEYDLQTIDYVLMSIRCAITLLCVISIVLIFVNLCRGIRIKSWRLYVLTSLIVFGWLALTLYRDHIDEYYGHYVYRFPQTRSIYACFRNLVYGLTLYLIVLLLSHLSDFQHHGNWLCLIFTVFLVPVVYSVVLLVINLRLSPEVTEHWGYNIGTAAVRIVFYNVATTVLVMVFSRRFVLPIPRKRMTFK